MVASVVNLFFKLCRARMPSMNSARARELIGALPLAEATCCLLREIMDEERLNDLFDKHRGRGYEKMITFPEMVRMIGDALLQEGGSGYRAFSRAKEDGELQASMVAVYGKLGRLSIDLSMAFLADRTDPLRSIFPAQARRQPPWCLRDFQTVILDGKAIKNVAKRLLPLRNAGGGLLGGRTLVALEYSTGLVLGMHAVADGDANDSRFVPDLLPHVRERVKGCRLWMEDRGFCDLNRLSDFTEEGDHYLVRYHPKNGFHLDPDRKVLKGKDAQGRSFIQEWGWLGAETHKKRRYVRRITLFRPGEEDVILVTDLLPSKVYPATELLAHYLERWGIERVFQQVTETFGLQSLIGGTPEATIFQFSFCLLLYNVMQTIRGFVAMHQKRDCESISMENLFRDTRDELTTFSVLLRRGVITLDHLPPAQGDLHTRLHDLLKSEWSDRWIKAQNKTRRRPVEHPNKRSHSSVYRLLYPEARRC
jgi:Transposase DDE domain